MAQFNLPPGVTTKMIDAAAGVDAPCECCGQHVDVCECPTCPACGAVGDLMCYHEDNTVGHGLKFNAKQLAGQTQAKISELKQEITDLEQYIEWLKDRPNETDNYRGPVR